MHRLRSRVCHERATYRRRAHAAVMDAWMRQVGTSNGHTIRRGGCPPPTTEVMLNAIIGGLLAEEMMPPGAILDAGAAEGLFACFYATIAPNRTVIAIDPAQKNVLHIDKLREKRELPNLQSLHSGLSRCSGDTMQLTRVVKGSGDFPLNCLDKLLQEPRWREHKIGLMHLDVEGHEAFVVQGGVQVINRDMPIVTTEVTVHRWPDIARDVLQQMKALGYDSYLIEEICGQRADIRNVIHLPRARSYLAQSHTLTLGVASRALIAVEAATITSFAFPCCAPGGACCPYRKPGSTRLAPGCCRHGPVHKWMNGVLKASGGTDLQYYTRTGWYDQKWNTPRVGQRFDDALALVRQWRNRSLESAGFSFYDFVRRNAKTRMGGFRPAYNEKEVVWRAQHG